MNEFWRGLLKDSENVTNIKIVCSDGVIYTHKIIIASISNFIKQLLLNIPVGDQVVLFLPDFSKEEVDTLLDITESFKEKKDIFGGSDEIVLEVEKLFLKQELDEENEVDQMSTKKEFDDENEYKARIESFDSELDSSLKEERNQDVKKESVHHYKDERTTMYKPTKRKRTEMNRQAKLDMKSRFDKAKLYYLNGKTDSLRKAARKFGVSHTTLARMIRTGRSYHGQGKKTTVMTEEEEKIAVDRIIERIDTKEELDVKIVNKIAKEVVREELENISSHSPDRKGLNNLLEHTEKLSFFIYNFTARHDLKRFYPENHIEIPEDLDIQSMGNNWNMTEIKKSYLRNKCTKVAIENGKNDYLNGECSKETEIIAKNLIPNPTTPKEIITNEKLQRKILIEKAKSYYLSGQSDSIRETAKKFNISHSTFGRMLKSGKTYQGKGKKTMILTDEEEKLIVDRIVEKMEGEQEFTHIKTHGIIKETVKEELEIVKVNFPERDDVSSMLENNTKFTSFVTNFTRRNGLRRFFPEDKRERNYECDVCFKKFTLKNSMVKLDNL